MRLSISAKIFTGFLVVLGTFGAVATYSAITMRNLGDELRLVTRGYLDLRLQVSELYTQQTNLLKELEQLAKEGPARARLVKPDLDAARRVRLMKLPKILDQVSNLDTLRGSPEEHALLNQVRARLSRVQGEFRSDEELFDEAFGPIGDLSMLTTDPERLRPPRERLWRQEEAIRKHLSNLSVELKLRSEQASLRLAREEDRAVWLALLLAVIALVVGVTVMWIATRMLRPLRTLAERAKEIARGDYKQRVDESAPDEIGALGREFNAMASALDEREQRLIRSERLAAVGKIAAQITHEVRNPLSSIGLNAEMLEEETEGEAKKLARAIVKEVDRLTEITEQYLRFARLPRPKLEREDLGTIVSSLLSFLRQELEGRGVRVEAHVDPSLPQVAADEHQLRQALLNLLRNAADAMVDGGQLTMTARQVDERTVELIISDTGEGITPEDLPKIFDPFFSTKEGGTGLGLALTQQIIVEHGGKIEVSSEPGRGTTFIVSLVAAQPSPQQTTVVGARVA
ncbi:MAG: integral rane sensor signal transduction histidine kinase [Myxococcales bacterium]|nr:integral rane sensor signal transduction histidine kinase [Myxococcales bacterium]